MSDTTAFLRYRIAVQRGAGMQTMVCDVEDIEALLAENEQLHADALDLIARVDENQGALEL